MQIIHYNEFLFEIDAFEACVLHHNHMLYILLKVLDFKKNLASI